MSETVAFGGVLPAGVPRVPDLVRLTGSERYAVIQRASDAFLAANAGVLAGYGQRWSPDPLRAWSRQWEYPFALSWVEYAQREAEDRLLTLLDAGSGATFFPFHVAERWPGTQVRCVDSDATLAAVYAAIEHPAAASVRFDVGRLQELPVADAGVDVVCCISVLEHTSDYAAVLREFRRVLRPGGLLIVTFDVSRDGRTDVAPDGAVRLLEAIDREFEPVASPGLDVFRRDLGAADTLTTGWARLHRPDSLPWRSGLRGTLGALMRLRRPTPSFYDCTVCCTVHRRPVATATPER